ncbi:hypothetical protein [Marixanthomonas ophiurae]|uniref:Uncharacterized protein n=1 Tax=Marixanthomonas ophiurae TaxID=387659 RepID=A0A3E1QAD2_9FLAO|nr:hypothetical protein [Marixanthomonas ophiurae]RFN59081.1 hypothetical protein DZ858_03105 [Marixanthomonas ophiurae]
MKTRNKTKSTKKLILKLLIGFIIGISFGFGIGKMVKSNTKRINSIETTLQQNCNCENIESGNSYTGIQFSKSDGISNTKLNFTLMNCDFTSSSEKEAKRLNDILIDKVEDYNTVDFITFHFKSGEKNETVKIKNGTIL